MLPKGMTANTIDGNGGLLHCRRFPPLSPSLSFCDCGEDLLYGFSDSRARWRWRHPSVSVHILRPVPSTIPHSYISMGGGISGLDNGRQSVNGASSRVMAFHSKPQWIAHLEASKATTKLMVVDFTATWCGPCRWMEPFVNELAEKFPDVEFIKVDVDELENVAEQFGVEAMPTFLFVRNGAVVDRIVGAKKSELQNKVVLHRNYLINN